MRATPQVSLRFASPCHPSPTSAPTGRSASPQPKRQKPNPLSATGPPTTPRLNTLAKPSTPATSTLPHRAAPSIFRSAEARLSPAPPTHHREHPALGPNGLPDPRITRTGPGMHAFYDPPIHEAAIVFINGQRAGSLWHPPYRLERLQTPKARPEPHRNPRLQHRPQRLVRAPPPRLQTPHRKIRRPLPDAGPRQSPTHPLRHPRHDPPTHRGSPIMLSSFGPTPAHRSVISTGAKRSGETPAFGFCSYRGLGWEAFTSASARSIAAYNRFGSVKIVTRRLL